MSEHVRELVKHYLITMDEKFKFCLSDIFNPVVLMMYWSVVRILHLKWIKIQFWFYFVLKALCIPWKEILLWDVMF